jgi:hypothetical protein
MTNKNFSGTAGTTMTAVYTCPASTTAVINLLQATNIISGQVTVNVAIFDTSATTETKFVANSPMNVGSSISLLGGGLVLEAGDELRIQSSANSSVGFVGSVTEIV